MSNKECIKFFYERSFWILFGLSLKVYMQHSSTCRKTFINTFTLFVPVDMMTDTDLKTLSHIYNRYNNKQACSCAFLPIDNRVLRWASEFQHTVFFLSFLLRRTTVCLYVQIEVTHLLNPLTVPEIPMAHSKASGLK